MKNILVLCALFAFIGIVPAFTVLNTAYQSDGKWYININGNIYGGYDSIYYPSISPDGKKWGFCYNIGGIWTNSYINGGKWYMNIEGQTFGPYDNPDSAVFSADYSNWGFRYFSGEKCGVNINGQIYDGGNGVWPPEFSPDGTKWAFYYFKSGGQWYMNINGQTFGGYERVMYPSFSSNSTKWGFYYITGGKSYVNINGQTFGGYDDADSPSFSPDGTKWGFNYMSGGKKNININGQTFGGYDEVYSLFFSSDGTKWGFQYKSGGKLFMNINGQTFGGYDKIVFRKGSVFSPDVEKWGFGYRMDNKSYVNINGQVYGGYDAVIAPAFSADGKKWEFAYNIGCIRTNGNITGGRWYLNVNGDITGEYAYLGDCEFAPDGTSRVLISDDGKKFVLTDVMLSKFPPNLELAVEADVGPQKILKAGGEGSVTLTIKNKGKGDAYGLSVQVKGISGTIGVTLDATNSVMVKAGSNSVLVLPISADIRTASGFVKYEIIVKEKYFKMDSNPVLLSIQTQEFLRPSLYLHDWGIVDSGEGDTIGNGNKALDEGETVEIVAIIANRGQGEAKDVTLTPSLPSGKGLILLESGQKKLGDLAPGEWKKVKILISAGKNLGLKEFPLGLKFSDSESYSSSSADIKLAIGSMRETPKEVAVARGSVGFNNAPAVNAPALTVDVDTKIPEGQSQGNTVAVVIGNRDYLNGISAVDYALQDERVMKRYFESVFKIPSERIMASENLTLSGLIGLFGTEADPAKAKLYRNVQLYKPDTVYIYYSGHGIPGLKDHKGYIAPVDVDRENVEGTAYALDLLYANTAKLKEIGVKHVVVILESCFSGESEAGKLVQNVSPVYMKVDNPMMAGKIGSIYAATSGSDYSVWYPEMGHGLFTYYFLKGLGGEADKNGDKKITCAEMKAYLEKNVPERSNIIRAFQQMPQIVGEGSEVLVRLK